MTDSPIYVQPTEADWIDLGGGVRRRMLCHDKNLMMGRGRLREGRGRRNALAIRTSRFSLVASGAFELDIGGDKRVLKAGDSYRVPADVVHGCVALEAGILIDTFTPHREDFLD